MIKSLLLANVGTLFMWKAFLQSSLQKTSDSLALICGRYLEGIVRLF